MKTTLHGISPKAPLRHIARHEAAHIVMLWLMDRPVLGCMISADGGLTVQLPDETGSKETQNEHILYALAGMVGEKNLELKEDLFKHIEKPEYFDTNTDSYHVAQAIKLLRGNPRSWLVCYELAISRLLDKFSKPYRELTTLLAEKEMVDFKTLHEMFNKWNAIFFPEGKLKSDVCSKAVLRAIGTKIPRKTLFGWDLRPLPEGWQQPKRTSLLKLVQMVGTYLQDKNVENDSIDAFCDYDNAQ